MKRRFHALIIACVIINPLAHAGIPVLVDADPLRELEWLKEAQRWIQTAQHYESQIQAYKDQLATATGVRNIVDFVDQAKSLKSDLEKLRKPGQTLNDLLLSGGTAGQFDALYAKYRVLIRATRRSPEAMPISANNRSSIRQFNLSRLTRSVIRSAVLWARSTTFRTVLHSLKTQRSRRTLPTVFS